MIARVKPELIGEVLHKKCTKCSLVLPLDKFAVRKSTRLGYDSSCKDCTNTRRRKAYSPEKQSEMYYKNTYGLSKEFVESHTNCDICKEPFTQTLLRNVDHCHTTGKVRGVLCRFCNVGLGKFYDSEKRLLAAVDYLRGSKC